VSLVRVFVRRAVRVALAGLAPPRLLVVCRCAPSSPPRSPPVEFVRARSLSWRFPRGIWSIPGQDRTAPPHPALRRRSPPAGHRRRCSHCTRATGSPTDGPDLFVGGSNRHIPVNPWDFTRRQSQPLDFDPVDQIRSPCLGRALLQRKPQTSSNLQHGPSTL
jgi:hypothetical protein